MRTLSRSAVAACVGSAVLALAACGGSVPDDNSAPSEQSKGLAQVDPCGMLTPDELKSFGFEETGELDSTNSSEPGCRFNGRPFRATFSKNQEKTVESFEKQDNWAKFERTEIDGRPAASAVDKSATQARICSALVDAGGGVVVIDVSEFRDQGLDECAEGLKIAKAVASKLPR
ncbi:DUF3558 domain-containing protein [Saccharopolyspora sp. NPDC002686]|uniref:DUF3558 domain-containing protein n=1 Tax=Saccharopolyspora sp. NPDC002686 TaxID=3154541 RepID=UPI003327F569